MQQAAVDDPFFGVIPKFSAFEGVTEAGNYRALPDDWAVATTDIVGSTKAIDDGRYKAVNMAGASVISALLNALGRRDLPFVFGGDGALVAVPGVAIETTRRTLADTQAWVADELGLTLRAAVVPIHDIRSHGLDVRVARLQVSDEVSYAMFTGGGASWAEAEMKAGRFAVPPAPAGSRPDLTGLSCRWNPIGARRGEIVSVIAVPGPKGGGNAFPALVADIVALAGTQDRGGHPVPLSGPDIAFSTLGVDAEARAMAPRGKRLLAKAGIVSQIALTWVLLVFGWRLGAFDPEEYRRDVSQNSDFRKFDDGLKMTIDIDAPSLARIEARLREAEAAGVCRYGLHSQDSALMTCLVVTPMQRNHIHFIDGAAGGYAMAAASLKAKAAAA